MPVIPLDADYGNIGAFIDSLFDEDVRGLAALEEAVSRGSLLLSFSGEGPRILSLWTAAWQMAQGDRYDPEDYGHCPPSDRAFIAFLSGYLAANHLSMFVPALRYVGPYTDGVGIYELSAYERVDLDRERVWDYSAVERFLTLFMHGAHFVVVHTPEDLPPGIAVESLYEAFRHGELRHNERFDPGNSHYTSTANLCSHYYPDLVHQKAPPDSPFVLSYLVGPTDSQIGCAPLTHNTFFQLEGWPNIIPDLGRHPVDYKNHEKTLWNLSTFGACAYSEKRATAVFLAPPAWAPSVDPVTYMPHFAGAETRQHWLKTQYVRLPALQGVPVSAQSRP